MAKNCLTKKYLKIGGNCILLFFFLKNSSVFAQENAVDFGQIHGNFQLNAQYYNPDSLIGAEAVPEKFLSNGFANINYTRGAFSAGLRYESYLNALQGFPVGYRGNGIPYRYVHFSKDKLNVTVGSYYEQFGSGLIFRSYEERGLGYDNAMDGVRLHYEIYKGVYFKGVIGKQRKYFDYGKGIMRGGDLEINLIEVFDSLSNAKTRVILGGSFISKYEKDEVSQYNLPENVGAAAGRLSILNGGFNFYSEYAYKINDPSGDNGFIYKPGHAALAQLSYTQKGLGINLSAKRVDNMSFRSERDAVLTEVQINYLPALTRQHTYNLLATLYPYASQPNGEMAFQGEVIYRIPKGSALGGQYGTTVLVNYSAANNIDTVKLHDETTSRLGYSSDFFKIGKDVYFRDFNVEVTRKISKDLKLALTYANLVYNKDVIEGKVDYGLVYAHVGVLEANYKLSKKHALRVEVQNLYTKQDLGSWGTALIEYTYSPNWFIALLDQYNYGNYNQSARLHYYYGSLGYTQDNNRIILSYGRQRAGIFCVGGVCRNVPASNGFSLTLLSSF